MSSTRSATDWVASLSPWPAKGFGLERMCTLLAALGEPQVRYPAVHVVGTNGKSTTTRMTEALLADAGLAVGAYVSPHVRGWSERIRIRGAEADFERAVAAVREEALAVDATQFETLTAAALLAFADAGVDAAVVEAGLGGRLDATNVLGDTREAIAAEKLAVVRPGCIVVLAEPEWRALAEENGAARVEVTGHSNLALAAAAAEAFLGRPVDAHVAAAVELPGRLERRGERPLEIWDGAHNIAGVGYLLPRLPTREYVLLCSILEDKRPELLLEALSVLGDTLVATHSSNPRAVPAGELRVRAEPYFRHVESVPAPVEARRRALALAGPDGALLVTGSLYLLAELGAQGYNP